MSILSDFFFLSIQSTSKRAVRPVKTSIFTNNNVIEINDKHTDRSNGFLVNREFYDHWLPLVQKFVEIKKKPTVEREICFFIRLDTTTRLLKAAFYATAPGGSVFDSCPTPPCHSTWRFRFALEKPQIVFNWFFVDRQNALPVQPCESRSTSSRLAFTLASGKKKKRRNVLISSSVIQISLENDYGCLPGKTIRCQTGHQVPLGLLLDR